MVNARVPEVYVHFTLMYTTDHIFPVLPIKDLINEDGDPTMPYKLATGTKPPVPHLRVLFFPCVVQKPTANVGTEALNMRHQAQKGFSSIFVGIPQHQKGYLVYVPSTRKIISSYDVVFDEIFSSALVYTSQPYSEAMVMRQAVTYTPCDASSREQTGNIIMFVQFEEGDILTKNRKNVESDDNDSIMPPLLGKEEMDAMNSGDESDHDLISTEMLEEIHDGSQYHLHVNQREARHKIRDHIMQQKPEWKREVLSTQNMGKGLH